MLYSIFNIKGLFTKSLQIFKRFPFVFIASFIVLAIDVYFKQFDDTSMIGMYLILHNIYLISLLGIAVFIPIHLVKNIISYRLYLFILLLAFVGLVLYYFTLPNNTDIFNQLSVALKHGFLILFFLLAIFWVPFIKSDISNNDYWQYVKQIIFAYLMTLLFTIIVIAGVDSAISAIDTLFKLDIQSVIYGQVNAFILGIFSVGFFLSQIPLNPELIKQSTNQPKSEYFFTKWILTSLSVIYFVILYVYTFKVLINSNLPKGILASMIVTFSFVAIITYLFWTPYITNITNKFRKWLWIAIFLQTIMLFVAIFTRVSQYAWTENRYMIVVLGIWLACNSLYFLFFKKAKFKWIFISLSILVGISQIGILSSHNISKISQTNQLQKMVFDLKQFKNPNDVPYKLHYKISSITEYLYKYYGKEAIEDALPNVVKSIKIDTKDKEYYPIYITKQLGFTFINRWDYLNINNNKQNIKFALKDTQNNNHIDTNHAIDVQGYDFYINELSHNLYISNNENIFKNINLTTIYKDNILTLNIGNEVIKFDLLEFSQLLIKQYGKVDTVLTQDKLTLIKQTNTTKVKLEFRSLNKMTDNKDKNIKITFSTNIFLKFKK